MSKSAVYFIHALSPLHPGVGQGVGSIDLPVAREKASGIPYLPGSSIKGVLRDMAMNTWSAEAKVRAIFGPETSSASEHAGAAYFGDAKLILLPVRSYAGIFAYATSPYLLGRFKREVELAGLKPPALPPGPEAPSDALVGEGGQVTDEAKEKGGTKVYLEDLDFDACMSDEVTAWEAWLIEQAKSLDLPLAGRMLYLHDDVMGFLLETALEVVTRIRIDEETKTVARGALWFEENIPAESVLYGLLSTAPETFATANGSKLPAAEILAQLGSLTKHTLQFGGNATIGRGLSKMSLVSATEGV